MKIVVAWAKNGIWHIGEVIYGPCVYPVNGVNVIERGGLYFGKNDWITWVLFPDVDPTYTELEVSGP